MSELADEQFISFREGSRLRELLMAAGEQAGFTPQVMLESNESRRIGGSSNAAWVSRSSPVPTPRSRAPTSPSFGSTDPPLSRDITLAWREDRRQPPAAAEFLALSRRCSCTPKASPGRRSMTSAEVSAASLRAASSVQGAVRARVAVVRDRVPAILG